MGRKSLDLSSRRMNSRLRSIAIISDNGGRVGLFDYTVITQLNSTNYERIYWIRKKHIPYIHYSQSHASLHAIDSTLNIQTIKCLSNDTMQLDTSGCIYPNQLYNARLTQLPFVVHFDGIIQSYPVYKIQPDTYLPWNFTIVDLVSPISMRQRPQRRLSASATCPITFESLTSDTVYWTPCGHAFSIAIAQALENDPRCPLCRAECTFSDCVSA